MTPMKKSSDMLLLEACFKEIKSKQNIEQNVNTIERILQRNFDLKFKITIITNNRNKFFGMSIYPSSNYVQALVEAMLNNKSRMDSIIEMWQKNKDWVLEIDSLLLYDTNLNANPAEITAVLMHEIGHIIYSNTVPQRIYRVLKYEIMNFSLAVKKLIRWRKAQRLFELVIIEACGSKNYRLINLKTERIADKFVVKVGYAENLDNFIEKLMVSQGNRIINRTEEEMDRDVKAIVTWTVDNITELEFRKNKLRDSLYAELLHNPSQYVKNVIASIRKTFFGDSDESMYKTVVAEQYLIQESKKIVQESILDIFDKFGKVKKITQSDIDILSVEMGRIENEDDKIYVLDLIYDKLDIINAALQLISENKKDRVPTPKETLLSYKSQLEKMRKEIIDMRLKEKTYGVFIKYPKGYEG